MGPESNQEVATPPQVLKCKVLHPWETSKGALCHGTIFHSRYAVENNQQHQYKHLPFLFSAVKLPARFQAELFKLAVQLLPAS